MRVRYTLRALADLEQIYEYFEKRRPAAAQSLKSMIERQIGWLTNIPPGGDGNSLVQRDRAEQVRELLGSTIRTNTGGDPQWQNPCVSALCSIAIPSIARPQLLAPGE